MSTGSGKIPVVTDFVSTLKIQTAAGLFLTGESGVCADGEIKGFIRPLLTGIINPPEYGNRISLKFISVLKLKMEGVIPIGFRAVLKGTPYFINRLS